MLLIATNSHSGLLPEIVKIRFVIVLKIITMTSKPQVPVNYHTVMPYLIVQNAAKVINEVADQPYGRSGGVTDPFGNSWWVTSTK